MILSFFMQKICKLIEKICTQIIFFQNTQKVRSKQWKSMESRKLQRQQDVFSMGFPCIVHDFNTLTRKTVQLLKDQLEGRQIRSQRIPFIFKIPASMKKNGEWISHPPHLLQFPHQQNFFTQSGFSGPKCFSMTMGSVSDSLMIVTPALAADSETKYSSCVSCP